MIYLTQLNLNILLRDTLNQYYVMPLTYYLYKHQAMSCLPNYNDNGMNRSTHFADTKITSIVLKLLEPNKENTKEI